jgi:hypothetical protein
MYGFIFNSWYTDDIMCSSNITNDLIRLERASKVLGFYVMPLGYIPRLLQMKPIPFRIRYGPKMGGSERKIITPVVSSQMRIQGEGWGAEPNSLHLMRIPG